MYVYIYMGNVSIYVSYPSAYPSALPRVSTVLALCQLLGLCALCFSSALCVSSALCPALEAG